MLPLLVTVRMTIHAGWLYRPFANNVEGSSWTKVWVPSPFDMYALGSYISQGKGIHSFCLQRHWQMVCVASQLELSCVQLLLQGQRFGCVL